MDMLVEAVDERTTSLAQNLIGLATAIVGPLCFYKLCSWLLDTIEWGVHKSGK